MSANYIIDRVTDDFIQIIDVGPWHTYQTVTNAAEEVCRQIANQYDMTNRRLYYIGSDNLRCELVMRNGEFAGFGPCTDDEPEPPQPPLAA